MRTGKDIDFNHVDFITYAIDEYLKDVPILEVVSNYVKVLKYDNDCYTGEYEDSDGIHQVRVHVQANICTVDFEALNAEQFIALFEGENVDPVPIIQKITGVDIDEYISDVTYSDGTTELLDVKGKTLLIGEWKRVINRRKK